LTVFQLVSHVGSNRDICNVQFGHLKE
jgi:hypothetical protein